MHVFSAAFGACVSITISVIKLDMDRLYLGGHQVPITRMVVVHVHRWKGTRI